MNVTPYNVGRYCLSEDDCIQQCIDFAAYERGVADAAKAFGAKTRPSPQAIQPCDPTPDGVCEALECGNHGAEPVAFLQFLSDVVTAAGLVAHGKQCKALGERLGNAAMQYRTAPPQASQPERYIVPEFTGIAQRKLADLMADGYQITGYSIERTRDDSVLRGAVTCGGMVLWWHGSGQSPQASQPGVEPVAWCRLTVSGQIAYFDGKPMVMPGPVGNEVHPVPLYTAPQPAKQPLPDEWIREQCAQTWIFETAKQWVRMTEQAHGIGATQAIQPLTDEQKQHIHNVTGANHSLICLVESYIKEAHGIGAAMVKQKDSL